MLENNKYRWFSLAILLLFMQMRSYAQISQPIRLIEFRDFISDLRDSNAKLILLFGSVTYDVGEKKFVLDFGELVREKLMKLAASVPGVYVLESDSKINVNPDDAYYKVEGNYWESKESIELRLAFSPLIPESKLLTKMLRIQFDRPDTVNVISHEALNHTFKTFADICNKNSSLSIELSTSVKDEGEVQEGQSLAVYVKSSRDCYFILLNRDAAGRIETLHPVVDENNHLYRNDIFKIPDVHVTPPFGLEILFVVASINPLKVTDAMRVFQDYYDTYISKELGLRSLRRGFAVAWTYLQSIPAEKKRQNPIRE